jgi:hypothetical protein
MTDRDISIGLVKTDLNGVIQWKKDFEYGDGWDASYGFCKTNDGGYLITGYEEIFRYQNYSLVLIKTDSNGEKEWEKIYDGPGYQMMFNVFQDENDNYIMAGATEENTLGKEDAWLLKTDSSGDMIFSETFGSEKTDWCYGFTLGTNGYVLCVTLNTYSAQIGDKDDILIIKTDEDGNVLWTQMYGGPNAQLGYGICQTYDNCYIACGTSGPGYGSKNSDALLVKFSEIENQRPNKPEKPDGPKSGDPDTEYTFSTSTTDPDGDSLQYMWDWGDGNSSDWLDTNDASYSWSYESNFKIRVKARDEHGGESDWSDPFGFSTPRNYETISKDLFWSDNFDSYDLGQVLDGDPEDGGWEIWDDGINNPRPSGGRVVDLFYRSPPHSLEIFGLMDILHQFTGLNSGNVTCSLWSYVHNEVTYGAVVVFASYYKPGYQIERVPFALQFDNVEQFIFNTYNWDEFLPLITDQWVEIRLEANLEDDWYECFYNNELIIEGIWSSTGTGDNYRNIAFLDLYFGREPVYFDDISIEWESNGLESDLDGDGNLNWIDVPAESTVTGSFTLENIGDPGSWLEWRVEEYPDFGNWSCEPNEGLLKPEDGSITVNVNVETPDQKNEEFTGNLKIITIGNPDDKVIIPVSLTTPKSRSLNDFNSVLFRLIEQFPILERLMM